MSYLVFARKWRPKDFDEIVGQGHVTTTLKNAIKLNRVSQAYLFSGPRGVGKTSTARILAKALNCEKGPAPSPCNKCTSCQETAAANSLDVIEIDGASNRGIDEIRTLRENVKLSPIHGKFKIYIIDEVHQITEAAFNALLKTLEEPPAHVKFIFATTQPHKIPATILSRCQRFDFKRVPAAEIVKKLKEISRDEKIHAGDEIFFEIAKASDGSMRDAESILDQLNSFCEKKIEIKDVTKILGIIEDEFLLVLTELIIKKDTSGLLVKIDDLVNDGKDLLQFLAKFIEHIRNLTVLKIHKGLKTGLDISEDMFSRLASQAEKFSIEDLIYFFYALSATYESAKKTGLIRFSLELALIKAARKDRIIPIDELLRRVNSMGTGCPPAFYPQDSAAYERPEQNTPQAPADSQSQASQEYPPVAPVDNSVLINSTWPELIRRLSQKRASLASFLMEGEPISCESGMLKIHFPKMHKFHKEILEKADNKKIVEGVCKEIMGISVRIEFNLVEKVDRTNSFKLTDDVREKKQEDDPVIKDALDVFNGSMINKKFNHNG